MVWKRREMDEGRKFLRAAAQALSTLAAEVRQDNEKGNFSELPATEVQKEFARCSQLRSELIRNSQLLEASTQSDAVERMKIGGSQLSDLQDQRLPPPAGATVTFKRDVESDEKYRKRFRQELLHEHKADNKPHIVPVNVGESNMVYSFGDEGAPHTWSPWNGILMCKEFERYLDASQISILAADDWEYDNAARDESVPTHDKFKVIVFDETVDSNENRALRGFRLHGRLLGFQSDFRPSRRYLCWKFIICFTLRSRYQAPYLRHSTLYTLTLNVGFNKDLGPLARYSSGTSSSEDRSRDSEIAEIVERNHLFARGSSGSNPFAQLMEEEEEEQEEE
ncbi:hypothetical protein IWX49DRAFT_556187 [Phyllosticta citricarpa]